MKYETRMKLLDRIRRIRKRFRYAGKKIVCPNCYRKFRPFEVHFRCQNPDCPNELDDKIGDSVPYPHAFPLRASRISKGIFIPLEEKCHGTIKADGGDRKGCGHKSSERLCPFCHTKLYMDAGLAESIIIAVVGGPGSSKSHYIVELFYRLRRMQNVGINPDIEIGKGKKEFMDTYFTVHPRGNKTPKILPPTQRPVRYHFVMIINGKRLILTLYDNPGENWEPAKLESRATDRSYYIANADGIILLIDLLQLEVCRELVQDLGKSLPEESDWFQEDVVETVYKEARKLIKTEMLHKPAAVCLSKIDELEAYFSDDREFYRKLADEPLRLDPYEHDVQREISEKFEEKLSLWAPSLLENIKTDFSLKNLFAIAPTGCRPDNDGNLNDYNPIRVEDPFIWILNKLGMIKGREEETGEHEEDLDPNDNNDDDYGIG